MILYLNRQYFVKLQGEVCMDNIILRCDNNINGIFTAIYDAFVYKNQMQKENHEVYRDNISIEIGIGGNYSLFQR